MPERQAQAGGKVSLNRAAGLLPERRRLWLVGATGRPVRFAGSGFFGRKAGAMVASGMQQDEDFLRAFVPLFDGDYVRAGNPDLIPPETGLCSERITALAILRRGQTEIPPGQSEFHKIVAPAAPEILLRDFTDTCPFDRRTDAPSSTRASTSTIRGFRSGTCQTAAMYFRMKAKI